MHQNNKSQKRKGGWPWSKEPVVDPNAPVDTNKGFFSSFFSNSKSAVAPTTGPAVAPITGPAVAPITGPAVAPTRLFNNGGKKRRNKSNKRSKKSKRNQSRKR